MRAFQASRSLALGTEPPKRLELHKKSRQYPLSMDEIHCSMCGATVYEISRLIDLQKINWEFKAGFHEHTGVSLKLHMPNNAQGGYTRVPQDTAEPYDCQRPPQSTFSTPISAMMCAWYDASPCCLICWCTTCPWRCWVSAGASAQPGIYGWQKALLLRGLDSLVYGHGGGRRPKLSPKQQQRLVELIDAGISNSS